MEPLTRPHTEGRSTDSGATDRVAGEGEASTRVAATGGSLSAAVAEAGPAIAVRPLTRGEVRDVDRRAIDDFGIPGIVLMENAGRNAAHLLHAAAGGPATVAIACGRGNNGGDGFVIARHLENLGHRVCILLACDPAGYTGDAAINHAVAVRSGLEILRLDGADAAGWEAVLAGPAEPESAGVDSAGGTTWIVDALLGTGASGGPRGPVALAIDAINARRDTAAVRTFAVDIPSGMDCDTGATPGSCIRADLTGTFVARKVGFDAPGADRLTGPVHVLDIGVPRALLESLAAPAAPA